MESAKFTNFSKEEFIGYWNGKGKKFAPDTAVFMPAYLAQHFATHLVNRELLRRNSRGTLLIKNGEKFVSPKNPERVPKFMELYNQAFELQDYNGVENVGDDVDVSISSMNSNMEAMKKETQSKDEPQVIMPPDFDEEDEDAFPDVPEDGKKSDDVKKPSDAKK